VVRCVRPCRGGFETARDGWVGKGVVVRRWILSLFTFLCVKTRSTRLKRISALWNLCTRYSTPMTPAHAPIVMKKIAAGDRWSDSTQGIHFFSLR
jgi:hypothetical protein